MAAMLVDASVLRIAVAYVTGDGVGELTKLVESAGPPATIEVVTRATHTTASREDLLALQDDLGAEVRAFVGAPARVFHPKVYTTHTPTARWVLSGSGNLTRGGLIANHEQFELLQLRAGPPQPGERRPAAFEATADLDLGRRWAAYWSQSLPLSSALGHPAYAVWEEQAARREELSASLRAIEAESERGTGDSGTGAGARELEHSRSATEQKVRARMDAWFRSGKTRQQVYELLADAMDFVDHANPEGWYAGYVTASRWGGNRLSVNARNAQVLVAHGDGEVFFAAPPKEIDAAAYERCTALAGLPGVRIEPSKIGETDDGREHPYACVPAEVLSAALDAGARELIRATIQWRMARGRSPKWHVHSPALVRVVARATGRSIAQPGYEP
jgi:hypothetical protein